MKNLIITLLSGVLCFGFFQSVSAQEEETASQNLGYEEGKTYFDIGIGAPRFGLINNYLYNSYGYDSYRLPVLRANLEIGFTDLVSGGFYAGYSHYGWSWTNSLGEWDERHSFFSAGLRGTFHFWNFLNEVLELDLGRDEIDLYASVMLGAYIKSHSDRTPSKRTTSRNGGVSLGTTVGAKYFFTPRTAVFLEGGYGSSAYGVLGLTFKI